MIRSINVFTAEVDDVPVAVEEILSQLDIQNNLLTHSIGLITCFSEFADTGVVKALSDALPFDMVGAITLGAAGDQTEDMVQLGLMVLTSDDVHFSIGLSDPITGEDAEAIAAAYRGSGAAEKTALGLIYAPLLHNVSGDFFVRALTDILDGAPIFGMMSSDHTPDYHAAAVIYQGETYKDRVAFVLVHGAVTPKFYIAHIAKEKLFREKAVITSSASNQLYTVNDMPAADFLKHIGLQEDASGNLIGINTYPFILDFGDGTAPIVRVMFGVTEDGAAICGGDVPVGAMLTVGAIDDESILAVSRAKLKEIAADGPKDVTLIFSCVGRYFSLGYESDREMLLVKDALRPIGGNYMFAYAGGEICPVSSSAGSEAGAANNRFHNDTFIACTF